MLNKTNIQLNNVNVQEIYWDINNNELWEVNY